MAQTFKIHFRNELIYAFQIDPHLNDPEINKTAKAGEAFYDILTINRIKKGSVWTSSGSRSSGSRSENVKHSDVWIRSRWLLSSHLPE